VLLLSHFDVWRTPIQVAKIMVSYSTASILRTVKDFFDLGLLISEKSDENRLERRFRPPWLWPIPSRYFHFGTKLDQFLMTTEQLQSFYNRHLKAELSQISTSPIQVVQQ
jgi:hypothetical protein